MATTPAEIVAERISERLVAEGLLRDQDRESCRAKLALGSIEPGDWRIWIENALEPAKPS